VGQEWAEAELDLVQAGVEDAVLRRPQRDVHTVINLRATTSQKYEAVPRRARVSGA